MHHRFLVAAFILGATLLCLRVPTVGASTLGLADGSYNIALDFEGSNTTWDGTAQVTIAGGLVTSFHFQNPVGVWDCSGAPANCTIGSHNPDEVIDNGDAEFAIQDTASPSVSNKVLFLDTFPRNAGIPNGFGGGVPLLGSWTVTTVPEPTSLSLLGFGVVALYLRRRQS